MTVAETAAIAALEILKTVVDRWVADGKDPKAEAIKIRDLVAPKAAIDAELQAEVDKLPSKSTPNTGT